MARLYWRVKVDGKWTWRPAKMGSRMINPLPHMQIEWGYFVQEMKE